MATCYRATIEPERSHLGPPFYRCAECHRVICHNCIGENLSSGAVLCRACANATAGVDTMPRYTSTHATRITPARTTQKTALAHSRPVWPVLVRGIASTFTGIANALLRVSAVMTAPFRSARQAPLESRRLGFDVSFTSFGDKVNFFWALAAVILVGLLGGMIYADVNDIPLSRLFLAAAATFTFWGIVAVYLQYAFDRALGRPMSQIIGYLVAFFLALILGGWLIRWEWLDKLLGVFGR